MGPSREVCAMSPDYSFFFFFLLTCSKYLHYNTLNQGTGFVFSSVIFLNFIIICQTFLNVRNQLKHNFLYVATMLDGSSVSGPPS